MAGPGLEPEKRDFSNIDNKHQNQDKNNTQNIRNKHITQIEKTCGLDDLGQISVIEKHVIDTFRAQYKHNEIPTGLINLVKAWPNIPDAVTRGILAMIECYIE